MKKVRVQALTTPETAKQVKELAIKEKRSVGNIAAILIEDGLKLIENRQPIIIDQDKIKRMRKDFNDRLDRLT